MPSPPYYTRLQAAAKVPPPEVAAAPSRRHRIIVQLCPREALAPVADPPSSPVAPVPQEPLFLGMDDNPIISSPPPPPPLACVVSGLVGTDYSLASPAQDLYNVDTGCPPADLTTPECQAVWEAELARSPTPPPTADKVMDAILAPSRTTTLVYRLEVQPLMPPPRWAEHHTPPPPPPDHHLPTNGEIAGWSEQFVAADLMVHVVDGYFPRNWEVPLGGGNASPIASAQPPAGGVNPSGAPALRRAS
ncbi:related to Mig1 protein, induced during biotrophic phase [Ustilago bromivora]|uniref:Related to Mig1 protein, induced during biotrophic phase n=1 Tax=Ustilago bromivora TaxID=307758 RepID=A0A8H8QII3_9BASI|nr:related to Mig1 protein, induced during biotrophic phase [Ustilago bromivora]